jgi:hypothetical protein
MYFLVLSRQSSCRSDEVTEFLAQKMLRHSNLATTLEVNTHVPQQDRLNA